MNELYISMYHYVRDLKHSRYPEIKGLDVNIFREQIVFLKKNMNIVTMEQVIDATKGKSELPTNACLLTFDDGYIDHFTCVMPILEELKVQGSFFIPGKTFTTHQLLDVNKIHYILASVEAKRLVEDVITKMDYYRGQEFSYASTDELWNQYGKANRFDREEIVFVKRMLQTALPERLRNKITSELFENYMGITEEQLAYELYMNETQIRTLKRHGMFIGLHGYDHYWLGNLSKEQMEKDISEALDVMDEFINSNCWVMNYPYGSYSQMVIDYIKSKGAAAGLTTETRVAVIGKDHELILPRFDCNDFPPKSENYKIK